MVCLGPYSVKAGFHGRNIMDGRGSVRIEALREESRLWKNRIEYKAHHTTEKQR